MLDLTVQLMILRDRRTGRHTGRRETSAQPAQAQGAERLHHRPRSRRSNDFVLAARSFLWCVGLSCAVTLTASLVVWPSFGWPELSLLDAGWKVAIVNLGTFLLSHFLAELASVFGQGCYTPLHGSGRLSLSEAADDSLHSQNISRTRRRSPVSDRNFYSEYHGHKVKDLEWIHSELRRECGEFIFLCGDSSLDNKHWFFSKEPGESIPKEEMFDEAVTAAAVNGYEYCLRGESKNTAARSAMDVCFSDQYDKVNCLAR